MHPPQIPEETPDVLTNEHVRRLLRVCSGSGYLERRDTAILRLLIDTGMRRQEIANLHLSDLDFDLNVAHVLAKGRYNKVCPFGKKTTLALDRYLRVRSQHDMTP